VTGDRKIAPVAQPTLEAKVADLLDAGDLRAAANEAVRGYGQPVLLYLVKLLQNHDAAEEVFARASEKLWRGLPEFRRESTISTWFHRIAWNAARDYRMEARHRRERQAASDELDAAVADVRTATKQYLKTATRDAFAKLREALDVEDRSLLVLRVERDLPWKEIAIVMSERGRQVDERALRKRYERLKARLKRLAKAEGLITDEKM
jgi:RNA polymerase sigma-70 factor (ECF subfamily)